MNRTLRRKLQKKTKRKPYRQCVRCGRTCDLRFAEPGVPVLLKVCRRCKYVEELRRKLPPREISPGGGIGRHFPS